MIIQCDNCQAKFRLDESQVPDQGRKVRCSKCKQVFLVQKPPPPPEEEIDLELDEEEFDKMAEEEAPPPPSQPVEEAFEPTVKIDLAEEGLEYEEEEEEEPAFEAPPPPPQKRRGLGRPVVIAAGVIVIIAAAAVVLGRMGKLPFLSGPPEGPTDYLTIDEVSLQGKWEENAQGTRIFVVKGSVENGSKKSRAFIKVNAMLLDRNGKTLKEAWAYCGNIIPKKDLRTKGRDEIQKLMRKRKQIAPGARIPFTVVFFDVPENVERYGAVVAEAMTPG